MDTAKWSKIIGTIALSAAAFLVGMIAYDSWKSWRTRVAAKKAAAISNGAGAAKA